MTVSSIKKNFMMNIILQVSMFVFPLITFPYVSRVLQPDGVGRVSFAQSVIAYFNMFAQLGIPIYGIRACAKVRDDRRLLTKTVHELFFLNLITAILAILAIAVMLIAIPRFGGDRLLYIVLGSSVLMNTLGIEWLYSALEKYTYITVRSLVFKLIAVCFMFLTVHAPSDYILYAVVTILSSTAAYIVNIVKIPRYIDLRRQDGYELKKHIKPVFIFFAMTCATTVYTNLDNVMLGFMKGAEAVGYYHVAIRIKSILISIVTSLGAVLLPEASYKIENNLMDDFMRISEKALNFVLLLASALMVYFMLFASEGIHFLAGRAYDPSILPMQIIMPTLLVIGITNILGIQMLIPMGRERIVLCAVIAGALADLVMNRILIPPMGAAGAAVGTLAAETVVFIVQFCYLKKEVISFFRNISLWKILTALILAAAGAVFLKGLGLGHLVKLVSSAVVFFGTYALILLLLKERLVTDSFNFILDKLRALL